jgi:hypothetical protein
MIFVDTCMIYDLPLWTYNKKDFRFLDIDLIDIGNYRDILSDI